MWNFSFFKNREKVIALAFAIFIAVFFSMLSGTHPYPGSVFLRCDPGADVELNITYGRFAPSRLLLKYHASDGFQSDPNRLDVVELKSLNGVLFLGQMAVPTLMVTKSTVIQKIEYHCKGLSEAHFVAKSAKQTRLIFSKTESVNTDRFEFVWPRTTFEENQPGYWLAGLLIVIFVVFAVIRRVQLFISFKTRSDTFLITTTIAFLMGLYLYYFPVFINPFNPLGILSFSSQMPYVAGFEGILYSAVINSVIEFLPQTPFIILLQNIAVFFLLTNFALIGKNAKQRLRLGLGIILLSFVSPVTQLFMQYFERGIFTCTLFAAFLLWLFKSYWEDPNSFDRSASKRRNLVLAAFFFVTLRLEYIAPVLPALWFGLKSLKRRTLILFSFVIICFGTQNFLDRFDPNGSFWRIRYNVITLTSYLHKIAKDQQFTPEEVKILEPHFHVDKLATVYDQTLLLKDVENMTNKDVADVAKLILHRFIQDPIPLIISRIGYAVAPLGLSPFQPWIYTSPVHDKSRGDRLLLTTKIFGARKLKGDPFFSERHDIYKKQPEVPFAFTFGILFIIAGFFMWRSIPVTSLICWCLAFKMAIVAAAAPSHALHYVLDVYWFCALVPILGSLEYWQKFKAKTQSEL